MRSTLIAAALCAAALAAPSVATADDRDNPNCEIASVCTHAGLYDINHKGWRVRSTRTDRPVRYACDENGWHCRYTRDYYITDDFNAVYSSGGGKPEAP